MRYLLAVDATEPAKAAADFLLKLLKKGDVVFIVHVQSELGFGGQSSPRTGFSPCGLFFPPELF